MGSNRSRNERLRARRRLRIRKKVNGTPVRPRLSVYRSLKHIQAQLIDDVAGRSLMGLSSDSPEVRGLDLKGKCNASREVGRLLATKAMGAGITQVVFDRGGYLYHGRVKALAEGAREAGLKF